jgi:predicted lipoprotein with Yx(FWY)xxD motif
MKQNISLGISLFVAAIVLPIAASAATVVTAKNGMTLYGFDKDVGGKSSCYESCAAKWPPYAAKAGEKMGEGWASVKRTDGSMQWTYDTKPVYFFAADKKKGDKTGDGVGGVWHIISE